MKIITIVVNLTTVLCGERKVWRQHQRSKRSQVNETEALKSSLTDYESDGDSDKILILNWFDNKYQYMRKLAPYCGGCWLTNQQEYEKQAAGMLLDNTRYVENRGVGAPGLTNRPPNQYWIFWPREAASKNIANVGKYTSDTWDGAFNLTTSYRRDSDIPRTFGDAHSILKFVRHNKGKLVVSDDEHLDNIWTRKNQPGTKHTAWLVSNCENTGGAKARWDYGQALIESGLRLDGYGECFNNTIATKPWSTKPEHPTLFNKYKFYLAFENSIHCKDYVSEKFWRNAIFSGSVPVVFGPHRDDVAALAPPHSFIHTDDFSSPSALVDYLDYLDNNSTAYMEYHQWRRQPVFNEEPAWTPKEKMTCGICQKLKLLRSENYPQKTIPSALAWWWGGMVDNQCLSNTNDHLETPQTL